MPAEPFRCHKCGHDAKEASDVCAYLLLVKAGTDTDPSVWQCTPSCEGFPRMEEVTIESHDE